MNAYILGVLIVLVATLMLIALIVAISRANRLEDDGPDTIVIGTAEPEPEALGDQVDVTAILKRYDGS